MAPPYTVPPILWATGGSLAQNFNLLVCNMEGTCCTTLKIGKFRNTVPLRESLEDWSQDAQLLHKMVEYLQIASHILLCTWQSSLDDLLLRMLDKQVLPCSVEETMQEKRSLHVQNTCNVVLLNRFRSEVAEFAEVKPTDANS